MNWIGDYKFEVFRETYLETHITERMHLEGYLLIHTEQYHDKNIYVFARPK